MLAGYSRSKAAAQLRFMNLRLEQRRIPTKPTVLFRSIVVAGKWQINFYE